MGSRNEIACMIFESYWDVLSNLPTRRERNDMCGALVEAFFTGNSCADRFKGETLGVYMQLEERMFFSRKKAIAGRIGGRANRKANAQAKAKAKAKAKAQPEIEATIKANVQANGEANAEQSAKPKTKTKTKYLIDSECVVDKALEEHTQTAILDYFKAKGASDDLATRFYRNYAAQGWKRANGQAITDWRILADQWIAEESEPAKKATPAVSPCPECDVLCSPLSNGSPLFRCESCGITWRAE